MARIRTIKPEFWSDGDLVQISRDARLFYIGLWNFADDNGVLEYNPLSLKLKIFPIDNISVENLVCELMDIGKLVAYREDDKTYICAKNLINHQVIDKPRKSNLPKINGNLLKSTEIKLGRKEGKEGREINNPAKSADLNNKNNNPKSVDLKDVFVKGLNESAKHKLYNELISIFDVRGWRTDADFLKPVFKEVAASLENYDPQKMYPYFKTALTKYINFNAEYLKKNEKEKVCEIAAEIAVGKAV